jgi:hypothetical protein
MHGAENALGYRITDALIRAFAVFFFLYPSLLYFQRTMKARRRRDNMETLFGVFEIPCDNKIRELMDGIGPEALSGCSWTTCGERRRKRERLRSTGCWTGVYCWR